MATGNAESEANGVTSCCSRAKTTNNENELAVYILTKVLRVATFLNGTIK